MRHLPIGRMLLPGLLIASVAACTVPDREPDDRAGSAAGTSDTVRAPFPGAEPPSTRAWRALGTEPFWGLFIGADGLRFTTPDDPDGMRFPAGEPARIGDTLQWTSAAAGTSLDARIWPGECSDNMSDKVWTHTSVVQLGSTTYSGCAELQSSADSVGG